jgi:hypothetical protein
MEIILVLFSAIVATTAMTIFSYVYSTVANKSFREPELLNMLIGRWSSASGTISKTSFIGWIIHYLVGIVFTAVFYVLWEVFGFEANLLSGVILGFLAGVVGAVGWQFTFWIHPNPPALSFKQYYFHLILAHIVFGIGAMVSFNWIN